MMKISLNAIKFINEHYGSAGDPAPNGLDDLLEKIGRQLAAVEEVTPFGQRFEEVIIVKVVGCEGHPNADRLHVCTIDDGGKADNVERDGQGLVQVVCAAPNVRAGMLAAWLPPGSTVPSTLGKEPFVLEARPLRGVVSNGMLASPKELTLGDSHEGILEVDEELGPITPGTLFMDAFHLRDDVVIDMENKMFTHRPDLFGWLGIARELEGIQHRPYKSPDWYQMYPAFPDTETEQLPFEVQNEIPGLVPRFTAVVLRDVALKPSPVWLQVDLARAGLRPINNIVDYTNHYMLLTGQPIHAYDYDKVRQFSGGERAVLTVRHPRQGEQITLLNGKTLQPRPEAMMVVAGNHHLACVGGAMGGTDTEVDQHTKNIILEAATWDMYNMRKTAMAHGIFTDAVTRFTKGQSPLQNLAVLAKIVNQIRAQAGGKVASPIVDINQLSEEARATGNIHPPLTVSPDFINDRLGLQLSAQEMSGLLANVEFSVEVNSDQLTIAAPFWRTDIEIPEDVVEEIGRLYGYDRLPLDLPRRDLTPPARDPLLDLKRDIRQQLAAAGANEVLTYSFVHGNLLDKVGQNRNQAYQLANALSPDLQYYRLSLTPSLLEKVHSNSKANYDQFALFEMGKTHLQGQEADGLPQEFDRLALVFAAADKLAGDLAGAAFYQAREYLVRLLRTLGVEQIAFEPLASNDADAVYYEPARAAAVKLDGKTLGSIGEYKTAVRRALKLPAFCAGFELDLGTLLEQKPGGSYTPLPRFPSAEQDICLKVAAERPYQTVWQLAQDKLTELRPQATHHKLTPLDIYQRPDDPGHKQITLRLTMASFERTLTDQEVAKLLDQVAAAAKETLGADRV